MGSKTKSRKKYVFVIPPEPIFIEVEAYTKKQAVSYFKLTHGTLWYCNIIKEKL